MTTHQFRVRFYVEPWMSHALWSSKKVDCHGLQWQVQAMIYPGSTSSSTVSPTKLTLLLKSSSNSASDSWEAEVDASVTIVNVKESSRKFDCEFSDVVSKEKPMIVKNDLVECSCRYCTEESDFCFLDESNCLTVEVQMNVKNSRGIIFMSNIDFSVPSEKTDVMFVIEEKAVHLNKEEIAKLVPSLARLFDAEVTSVIIEDVNYEDFVEFLSVICKMRPISDTNFKSLLELAKRFSLQHLIDTIEEQWLIGDHYFPPTEGLVLIVKYGLWKYRDWIVSEKRSWDDKPDLSAILNLPEYKSMNDRDARKLFEDFV